MSTEIDVAKAIQLVNETLVSEFEVEPHKVVPEARMREDLGLDSLDAVDLIVALEKAIKVQIPEAVARDMRTVGDVHAYIQKVASERGN
jgi:acyl carrier protein